MWFGWVSLSSSTGCKEDVTRLAQKSVFWNRVVDICLTTLFSEALLGERGVRLDVPKEIADHEYNEGCERQSDPES